MPKLRNEKLEELVHDFRSDMNLQELNSKYKIGQRALIRHLVKARTKGLLDEDSMHRILIDRIQHDFPDDPELRLESILSCMNGELKQATLLVLSDEPQTSADIWKIISSTTREKIPVTSVFSEYCTDTLSPIGFLVKELFSLGRGIENAYYTITQAGKKYGQPIAAFSLRYAVDHNISLHQLLGQTQSRGDSRAPYNRVRVVELVAEGLRERAIIDDKLGISTHYHLQRLKDLGIITWESISIGEGQAKIYVWTSGKKPSEARTERGVPELTKKVAQWLYEHNQCTSESVAIALSYPHRHVIREILHGLAEQGLCSTKFPSISMSEIALSDKYPLILNYAKLVRSALEDPTVLVDMNEMLQELTRNSRLFAEYLNAGIRLYKKASPLINAIGASVREIILLELIRKFQIQKGRGPRPIEAAETLNWGYRVTNNYMCEMAERGILIRIKERKAVYYITK